jgi:PIN domain nuclease of toxin-antitoxin system
VRLLLDTHIALWAIARDKRLPVRARELIEDQENEVFVSTTSLWEIAIKRSLARGRANDMPLSAAEAIAYFGIAGYDTLAITQSHAVAVEGLPPLHSDPFDRMLVAQALHEPMHLITHDEDVAKYSANFLLV